MRTYILPSALLVIILALGGYFLMTRSLFEAGPKTDITPATSSAPEITPTTTASQTNSTTTVNTPPVVAPPVKPPVDPPAATTTPVVVPKEIVSGNTSKRQVIFTFDGGAGNHSIDEILAVLDKHGLRSTFFVTGKWAEQNPQAMRTISARGHEIWNHTYSHPDLTTISALQIREEFRRTETIIKNLTGETTMPYFRPPYGARNATVLRIAAEEGYRSVYWTTDAWDWKPGITDAEVKSRIMNGLRPGALYLMHIGDDITGRILDEVFTEIKSQGYAIVPLKAGL